MWFWDFVFYAFWCVWILEKSLNCLKRLIAGRSLELRYHAHSSNNLKSKLTMLLRFASSQAYDDHLLITHYLQYSPVTMALTPAVNECTPRYAGVECPSVRISPVARLLFDSSPIVCGHFVRNFYWLPHTIARDATFTCKSAWALYTS